MNAHSLWITIERLLSHPSPQLKGFMESKGQKGEGYSGNQRQGRRGFTEALLPLHQRSAQQKETALDLGCKKGNSL